MSAARARKPLLVVGYDGSEEARAAVTYAAKRAGRAGRVLIVHSIESEAGGPPRPLSPADREAHGRAVLDALLLEEGNVLTDTDYDLELIRGAPAAALVQIATEVAADEIVVGSRGFGRVRAVLGSVSHDVLARADRPVVVVPHGALASRSAQSP